ncbi:unnamed protein product [Pleuronectes platessa]|uniref:Reverse transcriptase RNase H-like domain-containing protein n=1 Tax=Pleuronectes platessa TaxID=8262 RepID=A0A9N7UT12_PLEPL|nr:unnamed protein product [Pleuronectes platessa]
MRAHKPRGSDGPQSLRATDTSRAVLVHARQPLEVDASATGASAVLLQDSGAQMYNRNQLFMHWALLAQNYHINIRHRRGADNVVADALSRGWDHTNCKNV